MARRGLASLEFVMSMPLIVSMALLVFAAGRAGLGKTEVAVRARREAWSARRESSGAPALRVATGRATAAAVEQTASKAVELAPALNLGEGTAVSRHSVLAGVWDDRVPLAQFRGRGPHLSALPTMLADAALSSPVDLGELDRLNPGQFEAQLLQAGNLISDNPLELLGTLNAKFQEASQELQKVEQLMSDLKDAASDLLDDPLNFDINKLIDLAKEFEDLTKTSVPGADDILKGGKDALDGARKLLSTDFSKLPLQLKNGKTALLPELKDSAGKLRGALDQINGLLEEQP
jgi:hypothetical protein